jgi:hypothetical protein
MHAIRFFLVEDQDVDEARLQATPTVFFDSMKQVAFTNLGA